MKLPFGILRIAAVVCCLGCGLAGAASTLALSIPAGGTPANPVVGSAVVCSFTVTNPAGGAVVANETITFTIPTTAQYVSLPTPAPANGWVVTTVPVSNGNGTVTLTNAAGMPTNTSTTFTLTLNTNTSLGNSISLTPTVTPTTSANNAVTFSTVAVFDVSVVVSQIAGTDFNPVPLGGLREFQVSIVNNGPSDITSSANSTAVPAATLNVPYQTGESFGSAINSIFKGPGISFGVPSSFQNGTTSQGVNYALIASGANSKIGFHIRVAQNAPATITDTITLTAGAATFQTPANATVTSQYTTFAKSDLSVAITNAAPASVAAGSGVRTFTVTATNNGPSDASNVVLSIPTSAAGANFNSLTYSSGTAGSSVATPAVGSSGTSTVTYATLTSGATSVYNFSETIRSDAAPANAVDTSSITFGGTDPVSSNNTATTPAFAITQTADVSVVVNSATPTTNVGAGSVAIGDTITYNVTVTNAGPSSAGSTNLVSSIAANATYVSFSQVSGSTFTSTNTATSVTLSNANMPVGSAVFNIVFRVNQSAQAGVPITNNFTVSTTATDGTPGNNTKSDSSLTTKVVSDVQVTASVTPNPVGAGSNLTYTVVVSNVGPSNAPNVTFSCAVPANSTFVSLTQAPPNAFTFNATPLPGAGATGPITSDPATLAAGAPVTLTLVVNVNGSAQPGSSVSGTFTATLAIPANDTTPGNNTASASAVVTSSSDLAITGLTVSPSPTFLPPANLIYTFNVVNNGPANGSNVVVTAGIPAGCSYSSFVQTTGNSVFTINPAGPASVTATIASMATGTCQFRLVLLASSSIPDGTVVTNTISVAATSTDLSPNNNSQTVSTTATTKADISVSITPSSDPIIAGDQLTYGVVVTDIGPSDARNVSATITMPQNSTFFAAAAPAGWTLTTPAVGGTGNVVATTPTLAAGPGATLTLVVTVQPDTPPGTKLSNGASAASTTLDPAPGNNSATAMVTTAAQPALSIGDVSVPEGNAGNSTALIPVTLSSANTQIVTVDFIAQDGNAKVGKDYQPVSGTVVFQPGDLTQNISVQIIGNTIVEPDKALSVKLSNPVGATLAKDTGVITITNDDVGGTLQFSAAKYTVLENAGKVLVTVTRLGGAASAVTVNYATADGTAVGGVDYTPVSGTFTFGAGETTKVITVPLLNKYNATPSATFTVALSAPGGGGVLGSPASTTITILAAPAITSPLAASGQIASAFTYAITANGETPISYSVVNPALLPPGLFFSGGFITGTPTQAGTFAVPIRATNLVGSDTQTLVITIAPLPTLPNTNPALQDSDGDGFPDELELAIGTNPYDALSTPTGAPAVIASISHMKLSVQLNFAKKASDMVTFTGTVAMPGSFDPSGKLLYIDIGGIVKHFALDLTGNNLVGSDKFRLSMPRNHNKSGIQTATLNLTFKKGDFAALLADEGLVNRDVNAIPANVPVVIFLNSTLYIASQPQIYTARQGKSGRSKNP